MFDDLPIVTRSLQIVAGGMLATGLLFCIKRFNTRIKLRIAILALVIAAVVYVLFALLTRNQLFITIELVGLMFFLLLVWMGYQYSFWFIAMGWLLHVFWDLGLHPAQTAPYIPQWYTWLCVGFDIIIALYLVTILVRDTEK